MLGNPGYQLPALQSGGYNPGGGYMPTPIGGMWNQIAQQMAGPLFMPGGMSVLGGAPNTVAPGQPSNLTVPGFNPAPGTNYFAPNLYMPTTPTKTAPTTTPPSMVPPINLPPNIPLNGPGGSNGLGSGLGIMGGFGGNQRFARF